jgi:hypothetical protein
MNTPIFFLLVLHFYPSGLCSTTILAILMMFHWHKMSVPLVLCPCILSFNLKLSNSVRLVQLNTCSQRLCTDTHRRNFISAVLIRPLPAVFGATFSDLYINTGTTITLKYFSSDYLLVQFWIAYVWILWNLMVKSLSQLYDVAHLT